MYITWSLIFKEGQREGEKDGGLKKRAGLGPTWNDYKLYQGMGYYICLVCQEQKYTPLSSIVLETSYVLNKSWAHIYCPDLLARSTWLSSTGYMYLFKNQLRTVLIIIRQRTFLCFCHKYNNLGTL